MISNDETTIRENHMKKSTCLLILALSVSSLFPLAVQAGKCQNYSNYHTCSLRCSLDNKAGEAENNCERACEKKYF
jgi:hypothetical protein